MTDEKSDKDASEAALQRRLRMMQRGLQNLGHVAVRTPAPRPPPTPAVTPVPAPPGAAAPTPASGDAAANTKLRDLIEKRYNQLRRNSPSHFGVLGISESATKDQVKEAFLSLAKTFHPDRLPRELSHLAEKLNAVFESIRDAYEVLFDDLKRHDYSAELEAAKVIAAASNPKDKAEIAFARGEILSKRKEFAAAEDSYAKANELDPCSRYAAARAWALYQDTTRPTEKSRAKQLMTDLWKADPRCDQVAYQLGIVARMGDDPKEAEKFFQAAVDINPKHRDAGSELRLLKARKRK